MTLTKVNGLLLIEVQTEDKIDPQTVTGKLKQLSLLTAEKFKRLQLDSNL